MLTRYNDTTQLYFQDENFTAESLQLANRYQWLQLLTNSYAATDKPLPESLLEAEDDWFIDTVYLRQSYFQQYYEQVVATKQPLDNHQQCYQAELQEKALQALLTTATACLGVEEMLPF